MITGSRPRVVRVPTNKQREKSSGPYRLCGYLDMTRQGVLIALLIRVQYFSKRSHLAVEGLSTNKKGRHLTQSYDKSPYTNKKIQKAKRAHKTQRLRTDLERSVDYSYPPDVVNLTRFTDQTLPLSATGM